MTTKKRCPPLLVMLALSLSYIQVGTQNPRPLSENISSASESLRTTDDHARLSFPLCR